VVSEWLASSVIVGHCTCALSISVFATLAARYGPAEMARHGLAGEVAAVVEAADHLDGVGRVGPGLRVPPDAAETVLVLAFFIF
jgi:hypothetical protein